MELIRLTPITASHLEQLDELAADPAVQRFTRVPVPPPPGFARSWLDFYELGRQEGTRQAFALTDGGGGFAGVGVAPRIDRPGRTAELGYVVAAAARRRGVGTRALRLLTEWAFDDLDAVRLELLISVANLPSQRVAENCGYVFEGVLRSFHVKQELREDTQIWSRLAGEGERTP